MLCAAPSLILTFAAVSIVCIALLCYLSMKEVHDYRIIEVISQVNVDRSSLGMKEKQDQLIYLDFDMLSLNCDDFGIDVVDHAGNLVLDATRPNSRTPGSESSTSATSLQKVPLSSTPSQGMPFRHLL